MSTAAPILGIHHVPSLTQARYEEVVRRLTNGRGHPLHSMSELPFDGILVHIATQTEDGFLICDVFESREAIQRFSQRMGTIPQEVGITEGLTYYPMHTFLTA